MKKFLTTLLALSATGCLALGMTACGGNGEKPDNSDSTPPAPQNQAPVIKLGMPEMADLYPSDIEDIDWFADVTVEDDNDEGLSASITDWGGLDVSEPVAGTYILTYTATDSEGLVGTATRTVIIEQALPQLTVEVPKDENYNDGIDNNVLLAFEGQNFLTLTESPAEAFKVGSYVFKNASSGDITVSVNGGFGAAVILNENGLSVEARDGANGKLMNAEFPKRTGTHPAAEFAKNMTIPANGYAIVVQSGYTGGATFDTDGRGYIVKNLGSNYHSVARLYTTDAPTSYLTTYQDMAPVVKSAGAISVGLSATEADVRAELIKGLDVKDDNGTFEVSDDASAQLTYTVVDLGNFVAGTEGKYTANMTVSDGVNTVEFTREINVQNKVFTLTVNGQVLSIPEDKVTVLDSADDSCPSTLTDGIIIIKSSFKSAGGTLNYGGNGGVTAILNQYGELVRAYDGYSNKIVDETNTYPGYAESTINYKSATYAWNTLSEGEYMIIAPHSVNTDIGKFFNSNMRFNIGKQVSLVGVDKTITFETKPADETTEA